MSGIHFSGITAVVENLIRVVGQLDSECGGLSQPLLLSVWLSVDVVMALLSI